MQAEFVDFKFKGSISQNFEYWIFRIFCGSSTVLLSLGVDGKKKFKKN